jgi:hypothetical protein
MPITPEAIVKQHTRINIPNIPLFFTAHPCWIGLFMNNPALFIPLIPHEKRNLFCWVIYCTFTALTRKSLIYNGAGEGNRTLVYSKVVYGGVVYLICWTICIVLRRVTCTTCTCYGVFIPQRPFALLVCRLF